MKSYEQQFMECKSAGFQGKRASDSDSENIDLEKDEKDEKDENSCNFTCLKFGGMCSAGNTACLVMRSLH